jgi:hypothetical protein
VEIKVFKMDRSKFKSPKMSKRRRIEKEFEDEFHQDDTFDVKVLSGKTSEKCNPIQDMKKLDEYMDHFCHGTPGVRYNMDDNSWDVDEMDDPEYDIPVYSRGHISNLLREATSFRNDAGFDITFPPCRRGAACVGRSKQAFIPGLEKPITLCALMSPDEYDRLVARGLPPAKQRNCVLCDRDACLQLFLFLAHSQTTLPDNLQATTRQFYRCESNIDDEYNRDYMVFPRLAKTAFILFPIVQPCFNLLRASVVEASDSAEPYWKIDDSRLTWHTPLSSDSQPKSIRQMLVGGDFPFGEQMSKNANRANHLESKQ